MVSAQLGERFKFCISTASEHLYQSEICHGVATSRAPPQVPSGDREE